jgi:lysozyme
MSTALDTFKSFIETSFTELTKEQKEYDTYKSPEQGAKDDYQSFVNEMEAFSPSNKTPLAPESKVNKLQEGFRTTSQEGINFIANKENFREKAYDDGTGKWTIGYGSTLLDGQPVTTNTKITKEKALEQKRKDIEFVEKSIQNNLKVPVTQEQFDALVSLGYNIGTKTLANSTIISKLNSNKEVTEEDFIAFNKSKDPKTKKLVRNEGLENRRKDEFKLFSKKMASIIKQ